MAPVDDDIGFMGPILGRAKKVLFPDDYPVQEQQHHHAQKSSDTAVVNKKKKSKSRARRAGRMESAGGSSLANVTIDNSSGSSDGKENNKKSQSSSLNVSKNKKRGSAHRKMDSLAVAAASTIQTEAVNINESTEQRQKPSRMHSSTGGRRSDRSRSILEAEESSLLISSDTQQQNGNIRKSTSGRRSDGIQTCSLLVSSEPEPQQNDRHRRKSRVRFQGESSALPLEKNDEVKDNNNSKQQTRRRGRSNHPISSLVQSESSTTNSIVSKSKRGSSFGGISSRSSAGESSLMALPSSTQKKSKSPQRKQKKKSERSKPTEKEASSLNVSSLTNEVGRLSLDNEQKLAISPTFRSPLTTRQRSTRQSGEIISPAGILRFSTISNSNVFQQQQQQLFSMECSPVPGLNPRKRLDKKKTPPKIVGLTLSQSPSESQAIPDQSQMSLQELIESTSLPEAAAATTTTEMDIDSIPAVDAVQSSILTEAEESIQPTDTVQSSILTEAESYIGRRIARTFDKQVYHGTVTRFLKTHRLWKISYDDGDKEEMDFEEVSYAMDLYDGKIIEETEHAETSQDEEDHKPESDVTEIETAPEMAEPTKPKRTYSKLPKQQLQTTKLANESAAVSSKEDAEPIRRSTRAAKPTDRLTVTSWKTKSSSSTKVQHTAEEIDDPSPDSPHASNRVIKKDSDKPEQSQPQQVVEPAAINQDRVWLDGEVAALREAIKEMNPTSATYWEDVSSAVGTKSAYDCRQKWFSLVATPRVKRATSKKESKSQLNAIGCKLTGKYSSNVESDDDDDDDLFDSTPFRRGLVENKDEEGAKRSIFDDSKFSFGMSPCVLQQKIEKSGLNEVSDVKNRRKGYNTYIENLRKDLNRKNQRTKPNRPKLINKKLASESRIFVNESEQNRVSGQLLPDGTVEINVQEESFNEEEMDDMWADSSDEE